MASGAPPATDASTSTRLPVLRESELTKIERMAPSASIPVKRIPMFVREMPCWAMKTGRNVVRPRTAKLMQKLM